MSAKIDQLILQINGKEYKKFITKRDGLHSEEDLRIALSFLISSILNKNKIPIEQERHELTVYKGRIDSLYGKVIIEYKKPKYIEDNNETSNNKNAIKQIQTHIEGIELEDKLRSRYLGVVFDGYRIIFVRRRNKIWDVEYPVELTETNFKLFLKRLLSLGLTGKALIIDNLVKDFGTDSEEIKKNIKTLYLALNDTNNKKVLLLFDQWQTYFRQVCGYDFETKKIEIHELERLYQLPSNPQSLPKIIFSIHTLYSLFIKLLGAETLTYFRHREGSYISKIDTSSIEQLKIDILHLEQGNLFRYERVKNFLEGDFFGWYLDIWDEKISNVIKNLVQKFKTYDFSSLNLEPKEAKDLIKGVYHYLLPQKIRHSLGEYYTPDWLAEHLINSLNIDFTRSVKILDPTCGSGTFLVLLIEKIKAIKEKQGAKPIEMFNTILNSLVGIDLNPLAVIAARTNLIISMAELLESVNENFEIPIYLSDSMLVKLEFNQQDKKLLSIPTKVGEFNIPSSVVSRKTFTDLLDLLHECVLTEKEIIEVKDILKMKTDLKTSEINELGILYDKVLKLEKQKLNGIWLKIIKNFFTPAFLDKFDYIVGNPPWINWQTLPENYRESIKKYWTEYKIFLHTGLTARLGSAHDDLCVLLTYVVMDNFLKDQGKLGFVLPQNLLQASGGGEGFRRFKIKDNIPIKVLRVDDYIKVSPFSDIGASNKPAILILQKGQRTTYPVTYNKWEKIKKGTIPSDIRLSAASQLISPRVQYAEPIRKEKENSSWLIADSKDILAVLKKMVGQSPYRARKGVDTSLNGLYWGKLEPNRLKNLVYFINDKELSKKDVKKYVVTLESNLIYPILRGGDISKWNYNIEYFSIIPYQHDGICISENELKTSYPNAYKFFYKTDDVIRQGLENRAIYQKHLKNVNAPFYALYDIGKYTFVPYKVVWKALASGMISCVISNFKHKIEGIQHLVIPDHNVLMVPLDNESEAYYLSGIINSEIINEFVTSYISWFYSAHILEHLNIPKYKESDKIHQQIAQLSKLAHVTKSNSERENCEMEINKLAIELMSKV